MASGDASRYLLAKDTKQTPTKGGLLGLLSSTPTDAAPDLLKQCIRQQLNRLLAANISSFTETKTLEVRCLTYNVGEAPPPAPERIAQWLFPPSGHANRDPDIIAISLQEVDMRGVTMLLEQTEKGRLWFRALELAVDPLARAGRRVSTIARHSTGPHSSPSKAAEGTYHRLALEQCVGVCLVVFVRAELHHRVRRLATSVVKCGAGGVIGNKAGVGLRFSLFGKAFLFVGSHFVPHQGKTAGRNRNFHTIARGLKFAVPSHCDDLLDLYLPPKREQSEHERVVDGWFAGADAAAAAGAANRVVVDGEAGEDAKDGDDVAATERVLSHYDYVYWLGDLNYRLDNITDAQARHLARGPLEAYVRAIGIGLTENDPDRSAEWVAGEAIETSVQPLAKVSDPTAAAVYKERSADVSAEGTLRGYVIGGVLVRDDDDDALATSPTSHATKPSQSIRRVRMMGDWDRCTEAPVLEDKHMEDLMELLRHDQLVRVMLAPSAHRAAFAGFEEAPIEFPPSYKYDPGSCEFDSSPKARIPAWCDRILYKVNAPVYRPAAVIHALQLCAKAGPSSRLPADVLRAASDLAGQPVGAASAGGFAPSLSNAVGVRTYHLAEYRGSDHRPVIGAYGVNVTPAVPGLFRTALAAAIVALQHAALTSSAAADAASDVAAMSTIATGDGSAVAPPIPSGGLYATLDLANSATYNLQLPAMLAAEAAEKEAEVFGGGI